MPDVLLPTVGLSSGGGRSSNALDTGMRLKAFHPDTSILAHANRQGAIKYGQEALEVIDKYQKAITYQKKRALYDQAIGLYREDINSVKTQYTNLQGENAVRGLDEYNNNLAELQKKYAKVFNDSEMQDAFNLQMNRDNVEAKIDGRNWHDKQVQVMAQAESQARLDLAMDHWLSNLSSPFEQKNHAEVESTLKEKLTKFDGLVDGSDLYKATAMEYYDKSTTKAMRGLIAHDVNQASRALSVLKGRISDNQYNIFAGAIKDKLQSEAIKRAHMADIQENRRFRNEMRAQQQIEKEYRRLTSHVTPAEEGMIYDGYRAQLAKDEQWKGKENTKEFELEVSRLTQVAVQARNENADKFNKETGMLENIYRIKLSTMSESEQRSALDAPLTVFDNEQQRKVFLKAFKGDVKEAEQYLREQMVRNTSNTSLANFRKLDALDPIMLASVVSKASDFMDVYHVPPSEYQRFVERYEKGLEQLGNDRNYTDSINSQLKKYFKLSDKEIKQEDNAYLKPFMAMEYQQFLKKISADAINSKDDRQIALLKDPRYVKNEWDNFCATDYNFQQNINEIQELKNSVKDYYDEHKEAIQVNYPNEVSAISQIMSIGYDYFEDTGKIPSANQLDGLIRVHDIKVKAGQQVLSEYDNSHVSNTFDLRLDDVALQDVNYRNYRPIK